MSIQDQIIDIISDILAINHTSITIGAKLYDDLGADELDIATIFGKIESLLGKRFNGDIDLSMTVGDIVSIYSQKDLAEIKKPRKLHYQFAHKLIPRILFQDPDGIIDALSQLTANEQLNQWWIELSTKMVDNSLKPVGLHCEKKQLSVDYDALIITFPNPITTAEAFFAAIMYGCFDGQLKYITYEYHDNATATLGEWMPNGERNALLGSIGSESSDITIKGFIDLIFSTYGEFNQYINELTMSSGQIEYQRGVIVYTDSRLNLNGGQRMDLASNHFCRALELKASDFDSDFVGWFILGAYYHAGNDHKKAAQAYNSFLKINPDKQPDGWRGIVLTNLGALIFDSNNPTESIRYAEEALRLSGFTDDLFLCKARYVLTRGQITQDENQYISKNMSSQDFSRSLDNANLVLEKCSMICQSNSFNELGSMIQDLIAVVDNCQQKLGHTKQKKAGGSLWSKIFGA